MSESKFKQLQQDVCYEEPIAPPEPDKICPTCIPNEDYIEPDWTQTTEPYLNEKRCEYQVKVVVNIDGEIFHDGESFSMADPRSRIFKKISDSPYRFGVLLKSYIRPAVRKMLRFYGKLETDDIVCAAPPQNPGEICKGIFGLDYEQYVIRKTLLTEERVPKPFETIEINDDILDANPEIKNTGALELVARVQDYTFLTDKQKVLVVLVGIPAYRFDAVPPAPDLGSLNTSADQIVIKPPEFMPGIEMFIHAMNSFKVFQSYFYREQNGNLFFEESGNPFYIKFYAEERIAKFVNKLDKLLDLNGFDLKGFLNTGTKSQNIAFEVEISFDKTDSENPFVIKNVRARKKNCPYIECKKGIDDFIEYSKTDQTMMGYISNIDNITRTLKNNKTPPWLDFIVSNTFPQLAINYGSIEKFESNSCIDYNSMSDFILDEAMDLFKAIEYSFNKNKCKSKEKMLAQRAEIRDFFSGSPESVNLLNELSQRYNVRSYQAEKLGTSVQTGFNNGVKGAKKLFTKGIDFKKLGNDIAKGLVSAKQAIPELIASLNPCDFQANMSAAIKCLSASLTLDEVYYAMIKQIISSVGEEALEIILQTLPANKQEAIRKEVEKQFKGMPFPWEPGWQSGSLGAAVDRQALSDIKDKEGKAKERVEASASLKKQIQDLEKKRDKKIETLQDVGAMGTSPEALNQVTEDPTFEDIKMKLRKELNEMEKAQEEIEKDRARIREDTASIATLNSDISAIRNNLPNTQENRKKIQDDQDTIAELNGIIESLETRIEINQTLYRSSEDMATFYDQFIDQDGYGPLVPSSQFVALLKEDIDSLNKDIQILRTKKYKLDKTAKEDTQYQNFSNLSEEEQQAMVDKQKEKTRIVKTTPSDEIQEGTLGKAVGNIQKVLIQAYIDEIMKTATIGELQRAIENIPGADLLGKLVSRFTCGSDPLIYPPIESFLSTLTFDPCGTEKTRFSLPTLQDIPLSFNWVEQLTEAFYVALREIASRVMMTLMMKAIQLLETDLCKLAGNLTRNLLLQDEGWDGVLSDVLCPDPKSNDQRNKLNQGVLGVGNAYGKGIQAYQDLAKVLSVSSTQREIKQAMVGEGDVGFLNSISTLVKNILPQFEDVFADANTTAEYFQTMGNFLTPEQRSNIQDDLEIPLSDYPVETSICLTKEQKDLWDQERTAAFSDPELGREFVNKQDEKIKSDLSDAVGILLNGPDTALENALEEAFNPKDPDCKTNTGVVPTFSDFPQSRQQTISNAITGIFKRLEKAFIDDTIEANFFSSFFGLGPNTPGILSLILANNKNDTLNYHLAVKRSPVLNFFLNGDAMQLPETVGSQLKDYIGSYESSYQLGQDYKLFYSNYKTGNDNYTSRIDINDTFDPNGKIEISDPQNNINFVNDNFLDVPNQYVPNPTQVSFEAPFGSLSLRRMLRSRWAEFSGVSITSNRIFQGINAYIYDNLPKTFTVRRDGASSEGFLYGNEDTPVLEETDLVYVGPNGEDPYEDSFTEEDKVLGKSKTDNPRVHFLDPAKYGGTYLKPKIYIAEADHRGWLQFSKSIVPNPTGCDPKNSNFLMLDTIVKDIDKNKQKIQNHELLQYAPECTNELPFDKIANSDTLATLEGIVRATIRVHLSDFLIRSFSIFSNVDLKVNRNYDNILLNYITEKTYNDLVSEKSVFSSTYEGYVYALLFLEQVVQIVQRKVRDETMESNQEIEDILEICNNAQENHISITNDDLFKIKTNKIVSFMEDLASKVSPEEVVIYKDRVDEMVRVVESGCAILSGKGQGFDLLSFFESAVLNPELVSLEQARLASKVYTLDSVVVEMKKLLKYIIKEEMDIYTKKMREEIVPRPYIYDIRKFFIGGSHMLLGKQIEAGVYDTEVPIGGGVGNFPYGDINDCARRTMVHPLNNTVLSNKRFEQIKERGGFYLEKYIVSEPKQTRTAEMFLDPPRGIMSLSEFKRYIERNSSLYDRNKNISDYFGDATLTEDEQGYDGSIGVKYGVRLCYLPPEGYNPFNSLDDENDNEMLAKKYRSYILNPATFQTESGQKSLLSSRYSFPICSYEQDIIDVKMGELLDSNDNLNQDLKCYIDKLVQAEDYKHLVDNVIQIKKIPSIYLIYSYLNFLPSLGYEGERDAGDDENVIAPDRIDKVFNDSRKEARKLFISFYKNDDRDPPNEEENNDDLVQQAQRKLLDSLRFTNFNNYSSDIRKRLVTDNPLDKDGNECENSFGKLFTTRGK